jgi:hypothetical protein
MSESPPASFNSLQRVPVPLFAAGYALYLPDLLFGLLLFIFGVFPPGIDGIFPFIRRFYWGVWVNTPYK